MSGDQDREQRVASGLRSLSPPGEREAVDRAVALAAETAAQHGPGRLRVRHRLAAGIAAAAAGLAAALVLTPAGAAVTDWIGVGVDDPPAPTRTTIGNIPGGGELVVQSADGPWVVGPDGSRRLLGDYDSATWSPRGLYLAVTRDRTLTAVEPGGEEQWSIDAPDAVKDARWSTSGQRIAYRSGGDLRLVAGDGTADRPIATGISSVAPAWMPVPESAYSRNIIAFVDGSGRVKTMDVDTGAVLTRTPTGEEPKSLNWISRRRLLIAAPHELRVLDAATGEVAPLPYAPSTDSLTGLTTSRDEISGVAGSPDGSSLAVLTETTRARPARASLTLLTLGSNGVRSRELFTGLGSFQPPRFSPDGTHVLLGWRDADQWLFLDTRDSAVHAKPLAIGDVSRQFEPGAARNEARFPTVEGWCCA